MLALALAVLVQPSAPAADDSLLLPPAWVARESAAARQAARAGRPPRVVVLQVGGDRGAWRAGHVPGAGFVLAGDVSETAGGLPSELPPRAAIARTFAAAGVHDGARVVLYGEAMPVARAALALAAIGHARVSLLDGGLARWKREGRALDTADVRPRPGRLTVRPAPAGLIVDAEWVRARGGDGGATLLDVRTADEFLGRGPQRNGSDGHVPGARHVDWTELLEGGDRTDLAFRPRATLDSLLRARGIPAAREGAGRATVATYCTVGQRAAVGWLAARLLGYDARVYDGAWVDWTARKLPIDTGAARPVAPDAARR